MIELDLHDLIDQNITVPVDVEKKDCSIFCRKILSTVMYDVFSIDVKEPNAEKNYELCKQKAPNVPQSQWSKKGI